MKNPVSVTHSHIKASEYFCTLDVLEAKQVLFSLSIIDGEQKLSDSEDAKAKYIAKMYDGIITAKFARELIKILAEKYLFHNPGALMSQKEAKLYTEVNHAKLIDTFGVCGFDYVLTVLRQGKAKVQSPNSKIDEKGLLQALRWDERREGMSTEASNQYHRRKGLELLGFEVIPEELITQSFVIANVYEQITPGVNKVAIAPLSVRSMKIRFIEKADIIERYYSAKQPEIPEGYDKAMLSEGSMLFTLAKNGQLKDSEIILEYYKAKAEYEAVSKSIEKEFSESDLEVIRNNAEVIKELIKNAW